MLNGFASPQGQVYLGGLVQIITAFASEESIGFLNLYANPSVGESIHPHPSRLKLLLIQLLEENGFKRRELKESDQVVRASSLTNRSAWIPRHQPLRQIGGGPRDN